MDKRRGRSWWTPLRRGVQIAVLLAILALFIGIRRGRWPGEVVNLPMRLDPLAMLVHLLSSRTFLLGSTLALLTVALTLALGRVWCGWLCPIGTVLDLFPLRRWRGGRKPPAEAWRGAKYLLLLTILATALLGNLTLMILDPLTILFRTLSVNVWPGLDQLVTSVEFALYRAPFLRSLVSGFDRLVRPALLPPNPVFYRYILLYAGSFLGLVLLNLLAERFWCRYLCPLGGLLGLLSKVSIFRRRVNDQCRECNACLRACPTGTIRAEEGYRSDPGECTVCMECVAACPYDVIHFPPRLSPARWASYDPGRREAVAALGIAVVGVGLFSSDRIAEQEHPHLLRPPGGRGNDLLSRCIRCGECVRACPTGGIQPALTEAGFEGVWTPVLVPRLGFCDYSCNACGQVCPVQAIPPLSLEEKRQQVIGRAVIDRNRCIPWSEGKPCIVCEEMCPVPEKAIWLEEVEVREGEGGEEGTTSLVQRPHVIRERCIGCGICEYKCPVDGEAAIRVHVPRI